MMASRSPSAATTVRRRRCRATSFCKASPRRLMPIRTESWRLFRQRATAGQGTSAQYVVQLTNTGSSDDTFSLAVSGLPAGVTATFGETSIDVPPGASNFRDVSLTLIGGARIPTPGNYPFTVTASSTTDSAVTGSASGTLIVTAAGVELTLSPGSAAPGSSFQATVKNTGTTTDTYDLTLAGPAALIATLGTTTVTLAPGVSQTIPITTGSASFAVQGSLPLTAIATSTANSSVKSAASSSLAIPATRGVTAAFTPASQTMSQPGMATFVLTVNNTGNTTDSYTATITGENGPITASLVGLDGSPTQSIPVFYLPGLSTGAIELEVNAAAIGQGTVNVLVQSLSNSAMSATATATLVVGSTTVAPLPGPQVVSVDRYGYHEMPTTLVLTFDQALDAVTADDAKNYVIIGPHGRRIRVKSAVYDPANDTVTLHPSRRISVHYKYKLIVDGAKVGGVANSQGTPLDGTSDGDPGSNYRTTLTWRNLRGLKIPSAR